MFDELRTAITRVINNLQNITMPSTHDNCLYMYASLEELAAVREKLGVLNDSAQQAMEEVNQNGSALQAAVKEAERNGTEPANE